MNKSALAVLSLFSFLLIFSTISVAQLGEIAGQPHFNVSIGGRQSLAVTVVNQADYPLPMKVILPNLVSKTANAVTPTFTANPMMGNVPPGGSLRINITVYMPGGTNKPGYSWTGVMQMVVVANSSVTNGASITEGVAKLITVDAAPHIPSIWDYAWLMVLVVAAVVVVVVVLLLRSKGMLGGSAKKKVTSAKARARATRRKKAGARKKTAKRKGRKTSARARRPTSARRRRRR